ncbi:MAG: helix-turn-helix domain-containing protein [Clostridia bacterium]|nr:helix-turn-helix domain-containing protein [Clostridia bacterium]
MDKYLFGNKLYKLRTENNLTQKELAGVLGVSDKAVSKWETGEAMPRVKTLKNIADCFSVTYEDLLSEEEELKTNEAEKNEAEKNEVYESFYQKRVVKVKKDIKEHTAVLLFVSMLIFVMRTELEFRGLFTVGMPVYFSSLLFGSLIPLSLNITLCVLLMFFLKTELFNSSRNITVLFTLSLFSMISQAMFFISEAEIDLFMFLSTVFVLCSLIAVFMVFKLSQKGKMRFDLKRIVTNSGLMLLAGFALYLTRTLSFPEIGRLIQIAFINYFSLFILSEIFEYKNLIDVKEHDESIEKENAYIKVLCSLAIVSLVGGLLVVSIPGIVVKQQISELNKANATSLLYSDNGINFDESSSKKYTFDKLTFVLPDDYEAVNNDSSAGLNKVLNFKKANDEKTLIYFKKENEELDQASIGLFLGEDEELLKDCFKVTGVEPRTPKIKIFRHIKPFFVLLYVSMTAPKKHLTAPKSLQF